MSKDGLLGQWLGESAGQPEGRVLLDVERRQGKVHAAAYLYIDPAELPSTIALFVIPEGKDKFVVEATIIPFIAGEGRILSSAELNQRFPHITHAGTATIAWEKTNDDELSFTWTTNAPSEGTGSLTRSNVPKKSRVQPDADVQSWAEFKKKLSECNFGTFIFRGQSEPWPLQTSFHRTDSKILHSYLKTDIPDLHRKITGQAKHFFDLDRPQQLGAFLNLAQHHGFPTPLLDWTYSPFVAAWFAFNDAQRHLMTSDSDCVRIFALNKAEFSNCQQFQNLIFDPPHFSILETLAIENDRATPQQGLLTLTNLHDIEGYLLDLEEKNMAKYISAYDLPRAEAEKAINELKMMGISRSTMFPGIESICLEAKERLFSGL